MAQSHKAQERALEEAVSRVLRDNLSSLQRTAEELHEACSDLVASCSSSRPTNALPPMLRAQTAAAALAARLDILSNFITAAFQPRQRPAAETELLRAVEAEAAARLAVEPAEQVAEELKEPAPLPEISAPEPAGRAAPPLVEAPQEIPEGAHASETTFSEPALPEIRAPERFEEAPPEPPVSIELPVAVSVVPEPVPYEVTVEEVVAEEAVAFDVKRLPREEQELHRRANRLAKVAMQDIELLRPEQVRLGRERKDLCARLRSDLDKARKEYDRRFRTILDQPKDYFHQWLVAILAAGDPEALGEYPYPSPVLRR